MYSEGNVVRRRGGFSDRNKIREENTEMQVTKFDERTRISFSNLVSDLCSVVFKQEFSYHNNRSQNFMKTILRVVYVKEFSYDIDIDPDDFFKIIHGTIEKDIYDSVLTLLETIIQALMKLTTHTSELVQYVNEVFEKEYVGYRFVNGTIVAITDETEISSINKASNNPYEFVRDHLHKSILLLSDRNDPDYENSIKESISAVEAICEKITGTTGKQATLGKMLKQIENNGVVIHPSMKKAFESLYGYTSDANGIRHAGNIGGPYSTFEEAEFMLVSCSAFINYIISAVANKK